MNTWIVCVDDDGAKIFLRRGLSRQLEYCYALNRRPSPESGKFAHRINWRFAAYLSMEMELNFRQAVASSVVLCGDTSALDEMLRELSPEMKNRLVGVVGRNLRRAPEGLILDSVSRLAA